MPQGHIDRLVQEIHRAAREEQGLDNVEGDLGRMTWVAMKMDDSDTTRTVTITMSVDGMGTIDPPWDDAIAGAMGRMLQQMTVPPDEIGRTFAEDDGEED